ncbi:gfo/Idh/MocA family oxidoreductase [Tessaracoccus antarcticus]|uniref:Gfo/Idh/MocA family oxidoreductase n=1 Tax=Tessaracoccus antarcticus TaxID=2479848 RepID=A0A3M0GCC7_9ACTN|nr:gfo/Idh/MocA family oxidoreductase [Tessaracoccus antarcticus]
MSRIPEPHEAPTLRWGILAPGGIAHTFADAVRKHTRQQVVAVGSRSAERAAAFADEFSVERRHDSYEALVADEDVDAIYVASPHSHHAEHALLAINAGKHVLIEKAFTQTADQARQVVAAARAAGVTCMEAMWTRFLPNIDVVRQMLEGGALGDLEMMQADHGQYFDFDPQFRLFNPDLAGGAMLDLGVYPVSFASFVMGTPGRVNAVGTRAATGVDRQVSMVLDGFARHPNAHAVLNTTLAAKTATTATIAGSRGRIDIPGDFYGPQRVTFTPLEGDAVQSPQPVIPGHEGLAYEAAHFAQLVADGEQESPLITLDETIAIVETMEKALQQMA